MYTKLSIWRIENHIATRSTPPRGPRAVLDLESLPPKHCRYLPSDSVHMNDECTSGQGSLRFSETSFAMKAWTRPWRYVSKCQSICCRRVILSHIPYDIHQHIEPDLQMQFHILIICSEVHYPLISHTLNPGPSHSFNPSMNFLASSTPSSTFSAFVP